MTDQEKVKLDKVIERFKYVERAYAFTFSENKAYTEIKELREALEDLVGGEFPQFT